LYYYIKSPLASFSFIGDIHQPLHCSRTTDKGGNDFHVHFKIDDDATSGMSWAPPPTSRRRQRRRELLRGSSSAHTHTHNHHSWNLHSVWDTGIIDVALERNYNQSRTALENDLMDQIVANPTSTDHYLDCSFGRNQTCTEIWGQESWEAAIEWAYTLDDNMTDVSDGSTLTEAYYETRWPIVQDRLMAGGVRLAATLEEIFYPTTAITTTTTTTTTNKKKQKQMKQKPSPPLAVLTSLRLGFAM
jgi:hypothetical protein